MLNIDMTENKVAPVRIVTPRVQLIGYTKFEMPFDVDSEDPERLQMERDPFATDSEAIIEFAGRGCYRSWDRPNPDTATTERYMANILSHKHLSILRHAQVSFYITGVSRAFSHEMVTHAHVARSQESQRFVPADKINAVLPPLIREWPGIRDAQGEFHPNEFTEAVRLLRNSYSRLVQAFQNDGVQGKKARQAARYLLPNGVETRLTASGNLQAWLEFLTKRTSDHADAEFQEVANMIWHHLVIVAPSIFGEDVREIWDPEYAERRAKMQERKEIESALADWEDGQLTIDDFDQE